MSIRFRIVKAEREIGEGVRFTNGKCAWVLAGSRDAEISPSVEALRVIAEKSGAELEWIDAPDDDFAEPATLP